VEGRFEAFGPSHIAAMVVTALLAVGATVLVRRKPRAGQVAQIALAVLLLAASGVFVALEIASGTASAWMFLPLHLCDMAIFVAAYALVTRDPLAGEILYFWAFAGTLLAIVTPDLAYDVPSRDYFFYFGLHAGVVAAAASLVVGLRRRLRSGAPLRAWLFTNAYAGLVLLVNLSFGTNYMYLLAKPEQPSLLDLFGPWPIYLLVCEVVAIALFALLYLPLRRRSD
jgi:hypothetical integral membrane protein (TIGR02206 family)